MIRRIPIAGLLALLLGCGGGGEPAATTAPAAGKGAATPEEAVKRLVAAAQTGDVDKVLAQLPPHLSQMKKTMMAIGSDEIVFATVLDTKFGRDPKPTPRSNATSKEWSDSLRGLKSIEVRSKKEVKADRVLLTVWEKQDRTVETKVMALKDGDGWKLDYQRVLTGQRPTNSQERTAADGKGIIVQVEEVPEWTEPNAQANANYLQGLQRYRTALDQISKDVSGGRYAKREDANQARQAAAAAAFAAK